MNTTNWYYLLSVDDHQQFEEYIDRYLHFSYRNKLLTRRIEQEKANDGLDYRTISHLELEQSENSGMSMEEY